MKHLSVRILFFASLLFIPACGVWENFTTYFNLYYNTVDAYEQAEEAILLQERSIFSTEEISVPGSAGQMLTRVIEKTSKILQYHGTTSYVDDALMMLGKSFYYQKNYLKALRKFQELTATQNESDFFLEAELWIGRTHMRMREFDLALATLDTVKLKAAEEGEDQILVEAYAEEVIYHLKREDYQNAVKTAEQLLTIDLTSQQRAEVLYETGTFYLKLNDPQNALSYFEKVEEYSPAYNVEINAFLEKGRTLRMVGKNAEALEVFEELRLEDKYRDSFDIIDYEIGMTYLALGRNEEAVENLTYVDTSYATSLYSGLARYNLGKLYENTLVNFDSAAVYYQKAAASQLPSERVKEVHSRNQLFQKYQQITARISDMKKQEFYINNPDEFVKDSAAYADSMKSIATADSLESSGGDIPVRQQGRQNQLTQQNPKNQNGPPVKPTLTLDSLSRGLLRNRFDLANLFFGEMNKPDSAAKYYTEILTDTAASDYHSRSLYALGNYYHNAGDTLKADSIFNYIYDNYKNDRVVNAAAAQLKKPLINLSFDPAEEIYNEAERSWKEKRFEEALQLYEDIYLNYPASGFAPKAFLASGWILENYLGKPDSAAVMYDSVFVKYPGTPYALNVSQKLIAYKQEQMKRQRAIEDSIRVANQQTDTLKTNKPLVSPDSLTEVERLRLEMNKMEQDNTETEIKPDSLETEEIKPDTLQSPVNQNQNQNNERRNPRRRR